LSLEIIWLQENKNKRSDKLTFYDPFHITSAKEGLPPRIPCMQAMSSIQGKYTPTNQRMTHCHHMDWRAHGDPYRLHFLHRLRIHPRTHISASRLKEGASRAHKESAEPWVRSNWPRLSLPTPRGASWLVLEWISGVFGVLSHQCPGLLIEGEGFISKQLIL
jgi:hypothetical protein